MSLSIGIVGLPNVGKSTLFKTLTKNPVDISDYPFCTIEPNIGIVEVRDERLNKVAKISQPQKIIPAVIKFVDVAGLVKGASKGEGLGSQFLAHLRECSALLHIVRCFENESIAHIEGDINPKRDIEIIEDELAKKDAETKNIKENELFFLTKKSKLYLLNCPPEKAPLELIKELEGQGIDYIVMDARDELDKSEMTVQEKQELGLGESELGRAAIDQLLKKCYNILNLITFFTIVGNIEARAWPIENGSSIIEAAGLVHSDFKDKFIRAEVINWQRLVEAGSWKAAGDRGEIKTAGREYIVKDGDVIKIKI